MDINAQDLSLNDNIVAFWTENPDYAAYLLSSFESTWAEATNAQKRMEELGADRPSHL
jgi:hypothetical protein